MRVDDGRGWTVSDEPRRVVVEAPSSPDEGDAARRAVAPTAPDPAPIAPKRGLTRRFAVGASLIAMALVTSTTLALWNARTQKATVATRASSSAAAPPPRVPSCPEGMAMIVAAPPLRAFCIDRMEVTVDAYRPCVEAQVCRPAGQRTEGPTVAQEARDVIDPLCTARAPEARAKHPVNCVDWDLAVDFCKARGKRLPTEGEWVRAAFGASGATARAPWGAAAPTARLLNGCGDECVDWGKKSHVDVKALYEGDDGFPTTAPVGSFPAGASPGGALDMFGNVAEWVDDAGDAGEMRVARGGGWMIGALDVASTRAVEVASRRSVLIGFRCASASR